jgi:recombination protein RecA
VKKATATVDKAIVNTNNDERMRALQNALSMVEKNFGKGSVMQMGTSGREPMEASPTGALSLDVALGIGGIPKGRIIEIYGPESGGKTTLALHCVAEAQRRGEIALYIDAEHALDPEYARVLGVDVDNLYIAQPSSGEEALTIADTIIQSGAVGIVVVDSVAALVPRAEVEGEVGDSFVGLQARMMSQAMRKLGSTLNKSNTAAIFINQIREKIGVMYGNPETTPGGRALKFWASVRMEVRKGDAIKNGTDQIGARTKVKVVKNKVAPPFKTCEFDIIFGKGISKAGDLLDVATDKGVVSRSGTFYNYGETRLGQGRDNARTFLDSNPAVMDEIDQKVRAIFAAERSQAEPYVPEADTEEEPIA